MAYFQDVEGNLHYLSAADIANGGASLLPNGCVAISDAQAKAISNPAQTLGQAQATQLAILSAACAAQIVGGQQSSALGAPHTYPSNVTPQHPDQQNLASSVLDAVMAKAGSPWSANTVYKAGSVALANGTPMKAIAGGTSGEQAPAWPTSVDAIVNDGTVQWEIWATPFWCADEDGVWAWIDHSADEIQQVGRDVKQAVLACQAKNASLAAQVAAASTIAAVEAITW